MTHWLARLTSTDDAVAFTELPDEPGHWYAVWLDEAGARELTAACGLHVETGVVYAGECPTQSLRRHLAHSDIGSLTLMKNLAALWREAWHLSATNGNRLHEPGRTKLLDWMNEHLSATHTPSSPDTTFREVLAELDPPLRLVGFGPTPTPLRRRVRAERSLLV